MQRGIVQAALEKHPLVEEFWDATETHLGATVARIRSWDQIPNPKSQAPNPKPSVQGLMWRLAVGMPWDLGFGAWDLTRVRTRPATRASGRAACSRGRRRPRQRPLLAHRAGHQRDIRRDQQTTFHIVGFATTKPTWVIR